MASFFGVLKLTDSTITRNDEITRFPEPEAFRAFDCLFRPGVALPTHPSQRPAADSNSRPRPTKRRKLPNGGHLGLVGEEEFDSEKSAVLAKVALDLVSGHLSQRDHTVVPQDILYKTDRTKIINWKLQILSYCLPVYWIPSESQTKLPPLTNDSRRSLTLELTSFSHTGAEISLSVFDPASSTDIRCTATAATKALNPLVTHLEAAASVGAEREKLSPSSRNDYIPFCRCILSLASAQQSLRLDIELRWPFGTSLIGTWRARYQHRANLKILSTYLPNPLSEEKLPWTLSDFYDAVHVPKNGDVSSRIENSLTSTELYPYQQRSVDWMLLREGTTFSSTGELQPLEKSAGDVLPVSFSPAQDASGKKCYVSHVRGMVISDLDQDWDSTSLHGGILAEEMGLGKSVELIALMCLNKREITNEDVYDPYLGKMVKASGATLIITPPAILEQWRNEINKHAPQLKVFHYKGLAGHAVSKTPDEATVGHLLQFDVVLTSYNVLSKELHHATPPPDRSLRHKKVHERRNSPLVDISWWRVCLDEAQMVESGVSQAATVARIIPRCNAWAVSGTPLRNSITDLVGLLVFLRCEPFASTKDLFARLDKTSFKNLIDRIALRHTKDQIRGDLDIPPQKRVVITVPFTAIEEEYYKDMYRQMCDACFLAPDGAPLPDGRGLDYHETIERMREWLVRLRQTCLHSHVGEKNRKALGQKNRPRTVQEVLQVMIDQNDTQLKSEARELTLAQLKRGHILAFAKNFQAPNDHTTCQQAITRYKEALQTAQEYVKFGREEIEADVEKLRQSDPVNTSGHDGSDGEDDKDETSPGFARLTTLRRSLRSFLELEHACCFFIGNMHYQWKEDITLVAPDTAEYDRLDAMEKDWYDRAQTIRRELLKETETRTQRQMQKVKSLQNHHQDLEIPEIEDLGGMESSTVLEKLDTIARVINLQSAKMKEWRSKIIDILTMSLVDQDDEKEVTGDEYEKSTKVQDELYVYIQAFRTIVADMMTAVHGTEDALVDHEMQEAVKQARNPDITKQRHAPELLLQLAQEREQLRPKSQHGSLRGVLASARQMITSLQYRADTADKRAAAELVIAHKYLVQVQEILSKQTELIADLEKEQEQFRLTMNLRLEFYRQLMHISETVEDYKDEKDEFLDQRAYGRETLQIKTRTTSLQGFKVKQTYLHNLRLGDTQQQIERKCAVCVEDQYEFGILTACGHKYCRDCMFTWWKRNHNCPDCRTQLSRADMKEITYNNNTATAQEEDHDAAATESQASGSSSRMSIYSGIRDSTMNEIKTVKLDDSYGSKIDMMARHLLWIRNNDPGAKTIIYSQFADFLQVLRLALKRFKIGVSGIRDKNGIAKFKNDAGVECFLLDAKSNSSGLNLVNATYVFLCEPLINPALELQAIARVHRIGQKRATTVFMYIIGNTVEEAIYDISVKRRLEHMGRDAGSRSGSATPMATEQAQERTLDVANSEAIKTASLSKLVREGNQGEVVDADDLWKCLFGKPRNIPHADEHAASDPVRATLGVRALRERFLQQVEAAREGRSEQTREQLHQVYEMESRAAVEVVVANGNVGEMQALLAYMEEQRNTLEATLNRTREGNAADEAE